MSEEKDKPDELPEKEMDSLEVTLNIVRDYPFPCNIESAKEQLTKITGTAEKIRFLEMGLMNLRLEYLEMGWDPDYWMDQKELNRMMENKEIPLRSSTVNYPTWCIQKIEILKKELIFQEQNQPPLEVNQGQSVIFSNNQLVLIFYYFFKYCGIEPRISIDIAPLAKFMHLVTGKKLTTIQNSDFYKRWGKAPNYKDNKELIKDLEFIKPLFEQVDLKEIVKQIDNEIDTARIEATKKNLKNNI